jgi:hypothetical protein
VRSARKRRKENSVLTEETRTLAAAQIAATLVAALPPRDRGEAAIKKAAELAVNIAKAVEEAVARSLKA